MLHVILLILDGEKKKKKRIALTWMVTITVFYRTDYIKLQCVILFGMLLTLSLMYLINVK